ncbi:MAG: (2Fe-2S)-binding protein, partial [Caulobacteraceae bacterium]|nr:(2Fe-2S)-binding protein [Caulobacter sp.]
RTRPETVDAARRLLADGQWPRAGCAMLPHLKDAAREARPAPRRVCCLRYRIPGVGRCAGSCPLPAEEAAGA